MGSSWELLEQVREALAEPEGQFEEGARLVLVEPVVEIVKPVD